MVCGYGLHEAPLGRGQSLLRLIERGHRGRRGGQRGGPADEVAIIGKGMSTFEITVERGGEPMHECTPRRTYPTAAGGSDVAAALRDWNARAAPRGTAALRGAGVSLHRPIREW